MGLGGDGSDHETLDALAAGGLIAAADEPVTRGVAAAVAVAEKKMTEATTGDCHSG